MNINEEYKKLELKFYDLSKKVVSEAGLDLYDISYSSTNGLLRVYIFNKETMTATIDNCVDVDRKFSPYLESEDWVPEKLTLEVSSPGVNRKIKTLDHFRMSVGNLVKVHFGPNVEPQIYKNKKIIATLEGCDEKTVDLTPEKSTTKINVDYANIKSVNVEFKF